MATATSCYWKAFNVSVSWGKLQDIWVIGVLEIPEFWGVELPVVHIFDLTGPNTGEVINHDDDDNLKP